MEVKATEKKRKIDLKDYGTVMGFLSFEVLAFISFYLGHSFLLFGILSVVLGILLILVTFRQIKKDGITTYLFFLFPLVMFGLLTALNGFSYYSIGAIGYASGIFVPIAFLFIGLSGFLTSYIPTFKIKYALLVIYVALGLFVLINLFITMIYYVPFYTIKYANSYIFYDGKPSSVAIGKMAYMLYGFSIKEVHLAYWELFPSVLLTAVIPLFFLKFKENKTEFLIYAALSFIAFLSLLFTINKFNLISDLVLILGITIIVLAGKVIKSRPIFNVMMMTLGIILVIGLTVVFINAQTSWGFTSGLRSFISSKGLFNRLFNTNRFALPINTVFQDMFSKFKLFGCPVGGSILDYPNGVAQILSNFWLVDNLMTSGMFGAIFFLAALVIGIRRLFKYINDVPEENYIKFGIAGFTLGYLVMALMAYNNYPLINYDSMSPFYTSAPLLVVIFLLSYTFNKSLLCKQEEKKEETLSEELPKEEENQDEEIISL